MTTEVLSVRVSSETRAMLEKAAGAWNAPGASAVARDILDRWAAHTRAADLRRGIDRAVSFLLDQRDWSDDPAEFFEMNGE